MKIKPLALDMLKYIIEPLDTTERRARYLAGDFPNADRVQDLNKRYRWDLLWRSEAMRVMDLYRRGLNDAHIDTALRSIIPPLQP